MPLSDSHPEDVGPRLELERVRQISMSQRRAIKALEEELSKVHRELDTYKKLTNMVDMAPDWLAKKAKKANNGVTPVLMLSDLHLDEVVSFNETNGFNRYDRKIAKARFERVIDETVLHLKRHPYEIEKFVIAFLGDIITGEIHEELAATNEAPVPASIVEWVPLLASGLEHLASEFDVPFYIPCVSGNHDRTGKRITAKNRALRSYAWIIYWWVAHHFQGRDQIVFDIPESDELIFNIYDTSFLAVHGDSPNGGGGVGGIWPPIMRYVYKKKDQYSHQGITIDYTLMGHWHQTTWGPSFMINNSLKGYDEYARDRGFPVTPPSQSLFVVAPDRGVIGRYEMFGD